MSWTVFAQALCATVRCVNMPPGCADSDNPKILQSIVFSCLCHSFRLSWCCPRAPAAGTRRPSLGRSRKSDAGWPNRPQARTARGTVKAPSSYMPLALIYLWYDIYEGSARDSQGCFLDGQETNGAWGGAWGARARAGLSRGDGRGGGRRSGGSGCRGRAARRSLRGAGPDAFPVRIAADTHCRNLASRSCQSCKPCKPCESCKPRVSEPPTVVQGGRPQVWRDEPPPVSYETSSQGQ